MSQLNQELNQESSRPSKTLENTRTPDQAVLELSCVDLFSQLEHMLTTAKEADRGDQVEDSVKLANRMLEKLVQFTDEYLTGNSEAILEQITKAAHSSAIHKQTLSKRSWGATIMSVFLVDASDEKSKSSHAQLGKDLASACATVLQHAIQLVGEESEIGKQISQSMALLVDEFENVW